MGGDHQKAAKLHLIANPNAGDGRLFEQVKALPSRFPGAEIHPTERAGHAEELARDLASDGAATVVAVGGDGTIHEVVNGLLAAPDSPTRLAILPAGTGNDLCRSLGIPNDFETAVEVLAESRSVKIDAGKVAADGERSYFTNMSGGGFAAVVSDLADSDLKTTLGPIAYFWGALEALIELEDYRVRLDFDGEESIEEDLVNLFIGNGRWAAGGIPIAPDARVDDGLFDVIAVKTASVVELTAIASKVALGGHLDDPGIIYRRTRALTVAGELALPVNLDGETGRLGGASGISPPIAFEIEPEALEVVVGAEAPAVQSGTGQ